MQTCYKRRAKTAGRRRARRDKEAEPAPLSSPWSQVDGSHVLQMSGVEVDTVDLVDPVGSSFAFPPSAVVVVGTTVVVVGALVVVVGALVVVVGASVVVVGALVVVVASGSFVVVVASG